MAKQDYYKLLDVAAKRDGSRYQEGLSPPRHEISSGSQSRRSGIRAQIQGVPRRPTRSSATRKSAPSTTSSAMPASRATAAADSAPARHSATFSARCSATSSPAASAAASQVFRGADLRYELELDLEQAVFGTETEIQIPSLGECKTCKGTGAAKGSTPQDLRYLPRPGPGAGAAVDLHHPAALPALQGPRQDHQQSLRYLLRPGPRAAGEDAAGQRARRRRYRRSHSLERRGRGGPQRRPGRRPVRRDSGARTRHLRARRQPSVLRGADQLHHRGARRLGRGADARWRGDPQDSERDAIRTGVSRARERRAPGARRRGRRFVLPRGGRDAGEPGRRAEGAAEEIRGLAASRAAISRASNPSSRA